ncbi:transcriptional regulator [Pseudonocardiaceae bacterium YIM PH 21723]|nr:transcriptional regulator [Pseudonocardiaceae bacterium YIM PH 21723]
MDKVRQDSKAPRSYGQFCALARGLDLVGERWTLLIVRGLLAGPMSYTDLRASVGGIATNLLAERLRALESNNIVQRQLGDSGVLYALTPWGAELRTPMEALGRWALPLLERGQGDDAFQPRWLALAIPALLRGAAANPPVELGIETDGFSMVVRIDEDGPSAVARTDEQPETIFTGSPDIVVGLAAGRLTIDQAITMGNLQGDRDTLSAVFPPERANAGSVSATP